MSLVDLVHNNAQDHDYAYQFMITDLICGDMYTNQYRQAAPSFRFTVFIHQFNKAQNQTDLFFC